MASGSALELIREDDYIEYEIYLTENVSDNDSLLVSYLKKIESIVQKYMDEYLWHKDQFKLVIQNQISNKLQQCMSEGDDNMSDFCPHLHGITHFGDNIEDEWFIVFLLIQISKEINNVLIRVTDSDGEFLLIEAANHLPEWATPESCENRVFIHKGKLHIIPTHVIDPITIADAIDIIANKSKIYESSTDIQKCLHDRIQKFYDPQELHRVNLYLPIALAAILKAKPVLVAPAVIAFCNRDPIDLKACRMMRYFPPENRVLTNVSFTKHLYAMLTHSNYQPDRRTGWNIPPSSNKLHKAHLLGVRLACGFEILASQVKAPADLESSRGWNIFYQSLTTKNYFRDLLEHSKEYNSLLEQAKEYYREVVRLEHVAPSVGAEILELSKNLDYTMQDFTGVDLPEDDDEHWLSINPADLDELMEARYGKVSNGNTESTNLTKKISEFMNHVSSVDGAEFPPKNGDSEDDEPNPPQRPKRGVNKFKNSKSNSNSPSLNDTKINFDPNEFTNAIKNILDLGIPEDSWDLESGSEMSEYEEDNESETLSLDDQMSPNSQKIDKKLKNYMDAMDKELSTTTIGKSFVQKEKPEEDNFDDIENFKPIDIDKNLIQNLLASYKAQMGEAGPTGNLLGPMGVKIEDLNIDDE